MGHRVEVMPDATNEWVSLAKGRAILGVSPIIFGRLIENRFPLDAGWEGSAAAATQPRIQHRLYDLRRRQGQRPAQPLVSVVRHVVRDALRIDNAHSREGQALLAGEPRNRLDQSERAGRDSLDVRHDQRKPDRTTGGFHGAEA